MKSYYKLLFLVYLLITLMAQNLYGVEPMSEDYSYLDNIPLYSFTDKIEHYALSRNNERIIIQVNSKQTGLKKLYLTNSNGTGLQDIFSDGDCSLSQFGLFLEMKHMKPVISGNGEVLIQGLIPTRQVDKKSDYVFIYHTKTKKGMIISLKVLLPGCSAARFPKDPNSTPYSVDFMGNKIVACVEMGTLNEKCEVFESSLVAMNIDGSNQTLVFGPSEYSPIHCRFTWKNYPKSPRNPIISYNGDKIFFFGSIFETSVQNERTGDIFVMNSDGSNIRQLTFSKRLDPKPEEAGPFITNYYGSRIYYQILNNGQYDLISIGMDGSLPEKYFSFSAPVCFSISTDGKKIFFSHPDKNHSLVYFDVVTQRIVMLLDFTKPPSFTNYGLYSGFTSDDWKWTNTCDFSGNTFLYCINHEWIVSGKMSTNLLRPIQMKYQCKVNYPVVQVNHQSISIPVAPYLNNNRIMIPASLFFSSFGYPSKWFTKEGVLEVKFFGNTLQIYPVKKMLYSNSKQVKTAQYAELKNNQVFIPGYWAKDFFGLSIQWDSPSQTLTIQR